ncbi:Uncharacterized protein BP5553_01563 [Venustampulla echinocandica]|uniref:Uncharacterized protein n=1 Tax=Venustampulla echinocandica TaxID=2656787 RepID=A0A370U1E0_9HELO|nr:Uncharacterized protein BP5553_01563 [Venustampulla echinocandica]RDL41584.1 Uncharacterized protein BP5553_01563 [Venustampulla echinocandica]
MDPPPYTPRGSTFPLTDQGFETASIRSAAPSYVSTLPSPVSPTSSYSNYSSGSSSPSSPPSHSVPSLAAFQRPTWSRTQISNPTARAYHSIAHRRASALTIQEQSGLLAAALNGDGGIAQMKRRMDEEERERRIRTSEDPELVGEQAAEKNRLERESRENGWGVLEDEDKRWDWLVAQMSDWEERDKSWTKFRKELEGGKRHKLAKRLGINRS